MLEIDSAEGEKMIKHGMKLWWTIFYIILIINCIAMVYCIQKDVDLKIIYLIVSSCLAALGVAALWVIIFGIKHIIIDYLREERDKKIAEILKRKREEMRRNENK